LRFEQVVPIHPVCPAQLDQLCLDLAAMYQPRSPSAKIDQPRFRGESAWRIANAEPINFWERWFGISLENQTAFQSNSQQNFNLLTA
jgi:hypothetical protein